MRWSVRISLGATAAGVAFLTAWVPVEPRSYIRVIGIAERADGTRTPISVSAGRSVANDQDWVWRGFPDSSPTVPSDRCSQADIGRTIADERPTVRWFEAGCRVAWLALVGGFLTVLLHVLVGRWSALTASEPVVPLGDESERQRLDPGRGPPVQRSRGRRTTLVVGAIVLGIAALALGPCRSGPPTVERWVVPGEVPAYIRGGRLSKVWVLLSDSPTAPPSTHPEVLVLADAPGLVDAVTARARLRALAAEYRRPLSDFEAFVDAEPAVRYGRFVAIMDLFRSEGLWRVSPSLSPKFDAAGHLPVGDPLGTDTRLARVRTLERHVVASDASCDIHIEPDGALRVRPPSAGSLADPVAMTPGELAAVLRANMGGFQNATNPQIADAVVFVHADIAAQMAHVQDACHACVMCGYVRFAFVVQPPAAAAGGK